MALKHESFEELFTDIASAIRNTKGTTEDIIADDFPDEINDIEIITPEMPSLALSSSGLITCSANGLTKTKQLSTKGATTITPKKASQTAVSSGVYTTGAITVAGDSNLIAENIKSGISIFGVDGSLEGKKIYKEQWAQHSSTTRSKYLTLSDDSIRRGAINHIYGIVINLHEGGSTLQANDIMSYVLYSSSGFPASTDYTLTIDDIDFSSCIIATSVSSAGLDYSGDTFIKISGIQNKPEIIQFVFDSYYFHYDFVYDIIVIYD